MMNLVVIGLAAAGMFVLVNQCRKPRWWLGRRILSNMNARHAALTGWGLGHATAGEGFTILDVGCGGGRTVATLAARAPYGKVFGIDYSPTSVAVARQCNAELIAAGRVDIQQGTVSQLPFADATFDLVTAIETHYYWPAPVEDLKEVRRVLKPGGQVVVIAEAYRGERANVAVELAMKLLRAKYLTVSEHREMFTAAGYAEIETFEDARRGWLCCVARRPA